jgi:hypothetical protein
MKPSGDQVIGRAGDRKEELNAETRSCGEEPLKPTTEARGHGEGRRSNDFPDHPITCDHPITRSLYLCHPERAGANATPSRRTPTKTVPEHAASGSSHETLKEIFVAALQTIRATLREIFDESAYDRFLLRTHAPRSVASYRAFTRERDAAMVKKPRCC